MASIEIAVSPHHRLLLAEVYEDYLAEPGENDFVLRELANKKSPTQQSLVQGALVVSGKTTRSAFPLATDYPIHFRKTFSPLAFRRDPEGEYRHHLRASELIELPPPIGATRDSFRSCFIPGKSLDRLSPFGVEPLTRNLEIAREQDPLILIGLWRILELVFEQVVTLQKGDLSHGDLELHNIVVDLQPLRIFLIDFGNSVDRRETNEDAEIWAQRCRTELVPILREAVFVQCALGRQAGPLAEATDERLDSLFDNAGPFHRALDRRDEPSVSL